MRKCWWHFNYFNMASGVSALLCLAVCLFTLFAYTGAIPQITWCKHSFLFRSRITPNKKFFRAKAIKYWLHQPNHRSQKWIFDWYMCLFPGRYIPVVTAPWVPTCGAVPMWRLLWGTGIVLQNGMCCSWHGFCITSIFSYGLTIEALNSVYSGYGTDGGWLWLLIQQKNGLLQSRAYDKDR